jgi:hypothetical protein
MTWWPWLICCSSVLLTETYFTHSLGRNHLTGTIPTELGSIQSLSSLSLQFNDLSGTIPVLKNLVQLKALQVEGNDRLVGKIGPHNLLCQMRPKCKLSSQRWAFVMLQIHITYNSLHTTPFIKQYSRSWTYAIGSRTICWTKNVENFHCILHSFVRQSFNDVWQVRVCMLHWMFC